MRSTRSGRAAYGGQRSRNPARTSQVLIAINAAVWLLILATGGAASPWISKLALRAQGGPVRLANGRVIVLPDGVSDGAYWQLVTSMFAHVDIWHIGFNMLALWFLGPQLEAAIGRTRFLALYLVAGLTGSIFVYWLANPYTPVLGASGAIFGLLGALLVIAIRVKADLSQLLLWLGLNFVITVLGRSFISWQGHLGGFLGGAFIGLVIVYAPRAHRALWQGLGVGALVVVLLAAGVLRTIALT